MDMMMKMYFHSGLTDKNILIYGWDATDGTRMAGTLIAVFLIGAFYEWIKFVRVMHHKATEKRQLEILNSDLQPPQSWIAQVTRIASCYVDGHSHSPFFPTVDSKDDSVASVLVASKHQFRANAGRHVIQHLDLCSNLHRNVGRIFPLLVPLRGP